jgi:hypothetical protein
VPGALRPGRRRPEAGPAVATRRAAFRTNQAAIARRIQHHVAALQASCLARLNGERARDRPTTPAHPQIQDARSRDRHRLAFGRPRLVPTLVAMTYAVLLYLGSTGACPLVLRDDDDPPPGGKGVRFRFVAETDDHGEALRMAERLRHEIADGQL